MITKRRPRILIDVDGVLADFSSGALLVCNKLANTSYTVEDIKDFDIFKLPSLKEIEDEAWRLMDHPGWARTLKVYDGAKDAVKRLKEIGDVRIVTAAVFSGPTFCFDRAQWLEEHFGIVHDDIFFGADKRCVWGDVFIDDKIENIHNWIGENGNLPNTPIAILWDRPWNQNYISHAKVRRLKDWNKAIELISTHLSGVTT